MLLFSIIICTLNREEILCSTLRRVVDLISGRTDGEVIVVDQTRQHSEATERCLQELADGGVRWERVDFASLTRARNHGVRLARGEIILFLDDDVEPSPQLLDEHLACYADAAVWGVGGCTLLPGGRKLSKEMLNASDLKMIETGVGNRFDLDWPRNMTWAPGCNMSFRRNKLVHVGGFDEAFYGMAIGEETEFCYRIRKAGGIIAYAPAAELVHLVDPAGGCRDARAEDERTAQMLDNANYMLNMIGTPWLERWRILIRQCRTVAFNRRSLKEWTWGARCMSCVRGLRRAVLNQSRKPILPLFERLADKP